jgi:hypothetical protein
MFKDPTINIKKITFDSIESAIEHAKLYGGWIFKPDNAPEAEWYNIMFYTQSKIILESKGSGRVGPWTAFEEKPEQPEVVRHNNMIATLKAMASAK